MKSIIPEAVNYQEVKERFANFGLTPLYSGKVRETFEIPGYPNLLLFYATDRISIFDIVLNVLVPGKGHVLTAMAVMWFRKVFNDIQSHLIACGSNIEEFLPSGLHGDVDLQKRCMVVSRVQIMKVEAIVRGHLTGSGYADYEETGRVCGIVLPPGMRDGDELPEIIFTPSTKADQGEHDQNISFEQAVEIAGRENAEGIRDRSVEIFRRARIFAEEKEIIIADTKFEFGISPFGNLILADEILTPDSSRFWLRKDWEVAQLKGVAPQGFDKQYVREWGKAVEIKKDPSQVPPQCVIDKTIELYREGARIMLGKTLEEFQRQDMHISS